MHSRAFRGVTPGSACACTWQFGPIFFVHRWSHSDLAQRSELSELGKFREEGDSCLLTLEETDLWGTLAQVPS